MQLPFLAALAPDTPIVPIVMGHQTRETAFLRWPMRSRRALEGRRRAMLVASSDLSHFYDAPTAAAFDRRVIEQVDALDPDGLMDLLEQRPDHACGGGPMVTVLRAGARAWRVKTGRSSTTQTQATCRATSRRSSATWPRRRGDDGTADRAAAAGSGAHARSSRGCSGVDHHSASRPRGVRLGRVRDRLLSRRAARLSRLASSCGTAR